MQSIACKSHGVKLIVIYVDTLFLVNFSMDFLTLFITGKSLRAPIEPRRLALSAAIGAAYATVSVLLSTKRLLSSILSALSFAACAALMCTLAYKSRSLRSTAVFAAVNLGLGGLIGVLCRWLRELGVKGSEDSLELPTLILFALIAGGASLLYDRIRSLKKSEVTAELRLMEHRFELRLLSDSGDLLCEPISRKPVIVVSPEVIGLNELSPENVPDELRLRLRALPAETIAGKRLIYGFASELELDGRSISVVIAPVRSDFGGFDGLIPESIL